MNFNFSRLRFYSNVFFLVPLVMAFVWGVYWYALILGMSVLLSFIYHGSLEAKLKKTDIVFAWALMASNAILLILGHFKPLIVCISALCMANLAIYIFITQTKENYNIRHSLYHLFAAMICVFSLLVFQL